MLCLDPAVRQSECSERAADRACIDHLRSRKPDIDPRARHLPTPSHPALTTGHRPPITTFAHPSHPALTTACWFVCQLRDWLHVIANSKSSYELRYYNIHDQDADEDED